MSEVLQHSKRVLRPAQVAAKLGVTVCTVWRYSRTNPAFPRPFKLSPRATVFDEAELDAYVTKCKTAA